MDECLYGWMHGMDERMDVMDGCLDGLVGWMDGCMNEWKDR